ncbi:hypothetical protein PVK06_006917 [Gossypium arboreum]|uniref:Uncharacterized protein n=1 Tax=Gossypium arboreum TaxID=29729 RepID=A0ABR0QG62_GOSAR|nr:hypothetical protein PVK06_006917 [Gossypium arboreum]
MLTIESHATQVNEKGASMKGFGNGVNDDFELKESDTIIEVVDGVPSIHFYDKVYGLIEKSMARSMIIKLLGRERVSMLYSIKSIHCGS